MTARSRASKCICTFGAEAVPVADANQLETGFYAIQEPGTGRYLYPNQDDDLSVRPKAVALQPSDRAWVPHVFKVSR